MFRIFPQDLKLGDVILWDAVEGSVLSLKNFDEVVEVNVRVEEGSVRSWKFNKSQMLEIASTEEQMELYEPTIPDLPAMTGATISAFQSLPQDIVNMDEADTHPIGGIPTIAPKANSANEDLE